jgi:fluoroacetyl-CoA thioesterase
MEKKDLEPGLSGEFTFTIGENKIVPRLYPESPEFQVMPKVLATGFMVGLIEWACIRAINPCIDWPRQQTVGTHVALSHIAPTPPGLAVTVKLRLEKVEGRRLTFRVTADDGVDTISEGTHERVIISADAFDAKVRAKGTAPR